MPLIHSLQRDWHFRRLPATDCSDDGWLPVDLPHNPFVADLNGQEHWFGVCEYRHMVAWAAPDRNEAGARCVLRVGAAMSQTIVLVDGRECGRHSGGFLPFVVDLSASLRDGQQHELTLQLDNRHDPEVPPGKPHEDLDFCWFGGLYRGVDLRCYPALHITDAMEADEVAGGGVFVRTLAASAEEATVAVRVHVHNNSDAVATFGLEVVLAHAGQTVAHANSGELALAAGAAQHMELRLHVLRPRLWAPDSPVLHEACVTLRSADGETLDRSVVRCGVRRISFSRSRGFVINGRQLRLRGTNRHQEYPRVGYAVPRTAQRRDARRIKEAGFDYVRLSHYPQSSYFLEACDELGIVVMNCIPGWQYIGGSRFRDACVRNARELIRRDRNHPCVVLWELSLNETDMDDAFMERLHHAGHEEYPGDQMFTCGWIDRYDVFIHSRQHGEIHRWKNGDKALVIAEYGDWEFYAANEGFDQKTGAGVFDGWSHSRQRRADGERGLRQQAWNHIIALNDTLSSPAAFDGQWSMFDYARGYDPHRAACGVMNIFRLPKFSYHFYRSQRDPREDGGAAWQGGPVVYIASHWTPASDLRVLVFSNCDEVELRLNGVTVGREKSARAWMTQFLPHPPFVFDLPAFEPGSLEAVAYVHGAEVATHRVATPETTVGLEISVDTAGLDAGPGEADVLIAHAASVDERGNGCVKDQAEVTFALDGDGVVLMGPATVKAEAGVASVVLRIAPECEAFSLRATRGEGGTAFAATCVWRRQSDCFHQAPSALPQAPTVVA